MLCWSVLPVCALTISFAVGGPQTVEEAQQLEAHGDWKGAATAWRALAEQSPNDYGLWASLGVALAHEFVKAAWRKFGVVGQTVRRKLPLAI